MRETRRRIPHMGNRVNRRRRRRSCALDRLMDSIGEAKLKEHVITKPGLALTEIEKRQILNRAIALLIQIAEDETVDAVLDTPATRDQPALLAIGEKQCGSDN